MTNPIEGTNGLRPIDLVMGLAIIALGIALFTRIENGTKMDMERNKAIATQTETLKDAVKVLTTIQSDQRTQNDREIRYWQSRGSVHPGDYVIDGQPAPVGSAPPKTFSESE